MKNFSVLLKIGLVVFVFGYFSILIISNID